MTCRAITTFACVLAACTCRPLFAQNSITIEVRLTKFDRIKNTDVPVVNEQMRAIPSSGGAVLLRTDAAGVAKFPLASSQYVSIWIGDMASPRKMHVMSGRFSQVTSAFIDGSFKAPALDKVALDVEELLAGLKQSQRMPVEDETRSELEEIIESHLGNMKNADPDSRESSRRIVGLARELLAGPRTIGIRGKDLSDGVRIVFVEPDGPADRAGLRVGETICEIDGTSLRNVDQIREILSLSGDDAIQVTVKSARGGRRIVDVEPQRSGRK